MTSGEAITTTGKSYANTTDALWPATTTDSDARPAPGGATHVAVFHDALNNSCVQAVPFTVIDMPG